MLTDYPNSGSLPRVMNEVYDQYLLKGEVKYKVEDIEVITSIITDIAVNNPKIYIIVFGMITKLLKSSDIEFEDKVELLQNVSDKFKDKPNTELINVWLQRMLLPLDLNLTEDMVEGKLCEVAARKEVELWNNEWLKEPIREVVHKTDIIDRKALKKIDTAFEESEMTMFMSES